MGPYAFLDQLESELGRYFSGELQDFSIPLDLKGTPFQLAVWKQLRNIPYGNTNRLSEETRVQALNVLRRYRMMTANGSIPFGVDGVFGFAKNGKNLLALRASSYP
ncbi:MAG: methylated-DNA--[protein]-cysteine S-methyltransferase [Candidatus Hodarchaeales archaeon]|jgi:methylated-DNA-[protein]-cysteine S-methyltransferase